jgi:hypothetical protein
MAQAIFLTRPKTKPNETLKGKMNKWENGYAEFIPTGTRESNRRMIKQLGNSSFYKSEGEKESSYSLHLNVDATSVDPVGEMFQQFQKLTAGERKEMPQMPEGSEGRMLYDDGSSLKVWLDTQKGEVSILARLECSPLIERQLLQVQADMGRCIGRYRDEICKPINK